MAVTKMIQIWPHIVNKISLRYISSANSPDLNPVDCQIWGLIYETVLYKIHDASGLKWLTDIHGWVYRKTF